MSDNIKYQGTCYNGGYSMYMGILYYKRFELIAEVRGMGSNSKTLNHVKDSNVILGNWVDVGVWDDQVNADLLVEIFHYLLINKGCVDDQLQTKGGRVRAIDIHRGWVVNFDMAAKEV